MELPEIIVEPLHAGWTKYKNLNKKESTVYYDYGSCCSGVRGSFYESYHGYFPVDWIKEADLDRWIAIINSAGFPCKREENEKNTDFTTLTKNAELYQISLQQKDCITVHHALAIWTVIRYCYSPVYKGMIQTTFDLLDNIKSISPLEAIVFAHYCLKPENTDIEEDRGYVSTTWLYHYHGLLAPGIWSLPKDINAIFKKDVQMGINNSFSGMVQETKNLHGYKQLVTVSYDYSYHEREKLGISLKDEPLKLELEQYYKDKDWKALTSWYKKLRQDKTEIVEEPEMEEKVAVVKRKKKSTIVEKIKKRAVKKTVTKSKKKVKSVV